MEKSSESGVLSKQRHRLCLVGKRGGGAEAGPSTPSPPWRLEEMLPSHDNSAKQFLTSPLNNSAVSARKLCATLWEIQPHNGSSPARMRKRAPNPLRKVKIDAGFDVDQEPHQFKNANGADIERCESRQNEHTDLSSASYVSSMEVAPYRPPGNPVSSLKGPSAELLKILNKIWSLEEQQTTNSSLTKSLKQELVHSRAKVNDLLQEKQKEKLLVKELKEERKLREYSEIERGKLSKEISGLKSGFSTMMKKLERERKARVLLENLCDEFARGVRDYDSELRLANHKLGEDTLCGESLDHSVLHISEAWLDERMQMKQTHGGSEKDTIVDRLSPEIETFLRAKQSLEKSKSKELKGRNCLRRHSVESFPLNEAASAPGVADEHSFWSDFHGQERKGTSKQDMANSSSVEAKVIHRNGTPNRQVRNGGFRSLSLKGDRLYYRSNDGEVSSPLQKTRLKPPTLPNNESDLSIKLPVGVKENTLMAKLIEARLESRRSRSRASRLSV